MLHQGKCKVCGRPFSRNRPLRGATCGPACRGKLRRKRPTLTLCPVCGKIVRLRSDKSSGYCSVACFNRRRKPTKPDMVRLCAKCGKSFKRHAGHVNQRFCSVGCARWRPALNPRKCVGCGKKFAPGKQGQIYCRRVCVAVTRARRNREAGIFPNSREAKATLLGKVAACQRCGWHIEPAVLELHHRDRNARNNHLSNLEVLCPNCHSIDHYRAKDGQFASNLGKGKQVQPPL